jgi:hypothetical protein
MVCKDDFPLTAKYLSCKTLGSLEAGNLRLIIALCSHVLKKYFLVPFLKQGNVYFSKKDNQG